MKIYLLTSAPYGDALDGEELQDHVESMLMCGEPYTSLKAASLAALATINEEREDMNRSLGDDLPPEDGLQPLTEDDLFWEHEVEGIWECVHETLDEIYRITEKELCE